MDKEDGSILSLDATQYDATVEGPIEEKQAEAAAALIWHLSGAGTEKNIYIYIGRAKVKKERHVGTNWSR